jgi:hypothetical protein
LVMVLCGVLPDISVADTVTRDYPYKCEDE